MTSREERENRVGRRERGGRGGGRENMVGRRDGGKRERKLLNVHVKYQLIVK